VQNTAWLSVFNFRAVFSKSGRCFAAENGRKTPPGFQFLIFRRCFQTEGAVSRREMSAKHRLDSSFHFSGGVSREEEPSEWIMNSNHHPFYF